MAISSGRKHADHVHQMRVHLVKPLLHGKRGLEVQSSVVAGQKLALGFLYQAIAQMYGSGVYAENLQQRG